jgi:PAS domain-containing protein
MNNIKMADFNNAVMNETATWWEMLLPSGAVTFGSAKAKMLGYPDDAFKHYQDFVKLLEPEDAKLAMQAMRDHMEGKSPLYETSYRIKHKNGEYIKFYDCGQIVERNGESLVVIGFVFKIDDNADIFEQIADFRKLILEGNPSILEIVSGIKEMR